MNMFKKTVLIFCFLLLPLSFADDNLQNESNKNDYLYSQEYFDYLIECASVDKQQEEERIKAEKKQAEKDLKKQKNVEAHDETELYQEEILAEEFILEDDEPFKLHIESYDNINKYKESYKQQNTKLIVPINKKISYSTELKTSRNKYNSQDYKVLSGVEYSMFDFLSFSGGIETNYRGFDQNPNSRKIYITPKIILSDSVSITFPNKYNILTNSTDHDIGLNISPFKSKFMDFGVYGALTRTSAGKVTESINFSTNFYLF